MSRNIWAEQSPDNCRICEDAEQSSALQPLPICARCAYLVHDVIERAHGRTPGPTPTQLNTRRPPVAGHVYYVRRGDLIKIGFTTNLRQRMMALLPDEVLAVEPGSFTTERDRHRQFSAQRCGDVEWFEDSDELRVHIAGIVVRHGPPPLLPTMAAHAR